MKNQYVVIGMLTFLGLILIVAGFFTFMNSNNELSEDATNEKAQLLNEQEENKLDEKPASPTDNNKIIKATDCNGHWAEKYVTFILSQGLATGYPDGSFQPGSFMTRAEVVTLMIKCAEKAGKVTVPNNSSVGKLPFKDDEQIPSWVRGYLAVSAKLGFIKGYEDGTFRPQGKLTRQEICVIMIRYFGAENITGKQITFADANTIPNWSKDYISKALQYKLINGYPDNTFKPTANVTRAEVCAMTVRGLEAREGKKLVP